MNKTASFHRDVDDGFEQQNASASNVLTTHMAHVIADGKSTYVQNAWIKSSLLLADVNPRASPKTGFTATYLVGDDLLRESHFGLHQNSVRVS